MRNAFKPILTTKAPFELNRACLRSPFFMHLRNRIKHNFGRVVCERLEPSAWKHGTMAATPIYHRVPELWSGENQCQLCELNYAKRKLAFWSPGSLKKKKSLGAIHTTSCEHHWNPPVCLAGNDQLLRKNNF